MQTPHDRWYRCLTGASGLRLVLLLAVLLLDACGVRWWRLGIDSASLRLFIEQLAGIAGLGLLILALPLTGLYRAEAARRLIQRCATTLYATLFLMAFLMFAVVLSYLTLMLKAPLVDPWLARADQFIGFDWSRYYQWVQSHGRVASLLTLAYQSVKIQIIVVLFYTGLLAPRGQLMEFLGLLMTTCLLSILIAAAFPAQGAFYYYAQAHAAGGAWVSDFPLLRAGKLAVLNLSHMQGLITMPSFHTCMALIFTYALRNRWYLLLPAAGLNLLMILATPYCGGHYLVDVLAGALLTGLVLCSARRVIR